MALGTEATLNKLQDVQRRPPEPREALLPEIFCFQPQTLFQLTRNNSAETFVQPAEVSRLGPSGMTCEHLRPWLDESRAMQLLVKLEENFARAHVPQVVEAFEASSVET